MSGWGGHCVGVLRPRGIKFTFLPGAGASLLDYIVVFAGAPQNEAGLEKYRRLIMPDFDLLIFKGFAASLDVDVKFRLHPSVKGSSRDPFFSPGASCAEKRSTTGTP